jgi:carboxypeptidase Taq
MATGATIMTWVTTWRPSQRLIRADGSPLLAMAPGYAAPAAVTAYDRPMAATGTAATTELWERFLALSGTLSDLAGAAALMGWDRETAMPRSGAEGRAKLLSTVSALHHRELVKPDVAVVLQELAADDELDAEQRRAVELLARDHDRATRVPESLVRELSEAGSRCVAVWLDARPHDDFRAFAEALEPLVALKRRQAEAYGGGGEPYDALLDLFEPGATAVELEALFAELAPALRPLIERAAEREQPELPAREWPDAPQMAIARELAGLVGFRGGEGSIARSAHPFTCSPHHGDVRFTTRLSSTDPVGNIMAVMHEAGHALYDEGIPDRFARTPLHQAPSLGAHESQSRFWENQIGRTGAFWRMLHPRMRAAFGPAVMDGVSPDDLHAAATRVQPSLIRVEADEVTYNLHVVLRFELELALIRGELAVADLPGAWNDGMERLLGIRPPGDGQGCMQDIHWPEGMFGYFPTYTLGNLYAAQIHAACVDALGDLEPAIETGEYGQVLGFLRERIHSAGRMLDTRDLMREATGRELRVDELVAHLHAAYGA